MGQTESLASDSPTSLFRCRPRGLKEYARLRYQGALPLPKCLHFLDRIIAAVSPVLETFIFACLPAVLAGFLLGVVIRYNPPLFWMRLVFSGILAISVVFAVRWFWINPRDDTIELCSGKLHWRISLARLGWFRCAGSIALTDLKGFIYRSDCFQLLPLEGGSATNQQLARLWLEANLSRHDMLLYLNGGRRPLAMRNVFARFEEEDLRRFLDHLTSAAEPCRVDVP